MKKEKEARTFKKIQKTTKKEKSIICERKIQSLLNEVVIHKAFSARIIVYKL